MRQLRPGLNIIQFDMSDIVKRYELVESWVSAKYDMIRYARCDIDI